MNQPDQETIDRLHRWFAVECNNKAWELADSGDTSGDRGQAILVAAFAAAFHWSKVGHPVNGMRADLLLAHVHAILGRFDEALGYARRCLAFCETNECEDWDLAFVHAELSHAAAVRGNADLHARHYSIAAQLGAAIADDEDRRAFREQFARIPTTVIVADSPADAATSLRLDGVLESSLYVDDLERSAQFYGAVFGFERIDSGERLIAMGVPGRQVLLLFKKGASANQSWAPHDGDGRLHLAFAVPATELAAWEAKLAELGVTIEHRRTWDRGGTSIYFRDPDGHLLELATPGVWSIY